MSNVYEITIRLTEEQAKAFLEYESKRPMKDGPAEYGPRAYWGAMSSIRIAISDALKKPPAADDDLPPWEQGGETDEP